MSYHAQHGPLGDDVNWSALIGGTAQAAMTIGQAATASHSSGSSAPVYDASAYTVQAPSTPAAAPGSVLPSWAIPVAVAAGLGVVGLTLVVLLKKPVAKNRGRARCAH